MEIRDLAEGHTWVLGAPLCSPPRYVRFNASRGVWYWTTRLTKAESFLDEDSARRQLEWNPQLRELLKDGNEDVKVLKVEMKVGEAR